MLENVKDDIIVNRYIMSLYAGKFLTHLYCICTLYFILYVCFYSCIFFSCIVQIIHKFRSIYNSIPNTSSYARKSLPILEDLCVLYAERVAHTKRLI